MNRQHENDLLARAIAGDGKSARAACPAGCTEYAAAIGGDNLASGGVPTLSPPRPAMRATTEALSSDVHYTYFSIHKQITPFVFITYFRPIE